MVERFINIVKSNCYISIQILRNVPNHMSPNNGQKQQPNNLKGITKESQGSIINLQILEANPSHWEDMTVTEPSQFWDGEIYMQICICNHRFLRSNCIRVGQVFLESHHHASAAAFPVYYYALHMLVECERSSQVDILEPFQG